MTTDPDRDRELVELAERLEADARRWERRGLMALAIALREAAEVARGWTGTEWVE